MKRLLVLLCSALLVFGTVSLATADYVYCIDDTQEVNGVGFNGIILYNDDFERIEEITWEHDAAPCCEGEEGGGIAYVALTIVADDVDGAGIDSLGFYHFGEEDVVSIQNGEDTITLGVLTQMEGYTEGRPGYVWEEDLSSGGDLTVSVFDSVEFPALLGLDFSLPVSVTVDVADGYGLEVETSTLQIACTQVPVPSALLLLGSAVIGLVGFRTRASKKR